MQNAAADMARSIMTEFADLTGLAGGQAPKRYLWTDAFAVCNFLELCRQTGEEEYRQLTLRLVELEQPHRAAESWLTHREINMVMLATSLAPDGYLKL